MKAILTHAVIALLVAWSIPARADTLADLLHNLDSEDFSAREHATDSLRRQLFSDSTDTDRKRALALEAEMIEVLRTGNLSLEQRIRLLDSLRARFIRSPRAAIGIRFANASTPEGVELQQVLEGFPAKDLGLLKAGDVITTVAGVALADRAVRFNQAGPLGEVQSRLRQVIFSYDPGDVVEMTLIRRLSPANVNDPNRPNPPPPAGNKLVTEGPDRNAEVLTVQVPLGSFQDLRDAVVDPATLESAWLFRTQRLGIPDVQAKALASPLSLRDWIEHRRGRVRKPERYIAARPGLAGVIEDTGQAHAQSIAMTAQPAGINRVQAGRPERIVVPLNKPGARGLEANPILERIPRQPGVQVEAVEGGVGDALQTIARLTIELDRLRKRAADPALTENQRAAVVAQARRTAEAIDLLNLVVRRRVEEAQAEQKRREEQGQPQEP